MAEFDRVHRRAGRREAAARMMESHERGRGRPLEPAVRSGAERAFGHDFSQVRVHTDAAAAASAHALNAEAYAAGNDLVFAPGAYRPETREGEWLLAHELSHVVQRSGAPAEPARPISRPGEPAEQAAEAAADRVVAGEPAAIEAGSADGAAVQRYIANPDLYENMPSWGEAAGWAGDAIGGAAGMFGGGLGGIGGLLGGAAVEAGEGLGGLASNLGEMDPSWWLM
jgi:hypothetical protein